MIDTSGANDASERSAVPEPGLAGKFTLVWTPPEGWADAPTGFIPEPGWRPDPYWPEMPEKWDFWQVKGPPEVVAAFHGRPSLFAPSPDPIWVPAPGWTKPPAGWTPPATWKPDPAWPPAPPGWQFWHQPERDHEADLRTQVSSRTDRLAELNLHERLMLLTASGRARLDNPRRDDVLAQQVPSRGERKRILARAVAAHVACMSALAACRRSLFTALVSDVPVGEEFFAPKRVLFQLHQQEMAAYRDAWGLREDDGRSSVLDRGMSGDSALDPAQGPGVGWQQAELLAAAALRRFGYAGARVTVSGADAGLDVVGNGIAAQVKYTNRPVGRPVLQQLVGAAGGARTACFAASGYSAQALAFASERRMALFVIRLPNSVRAVNDEARRMASTFGA